MILDEGAVIHGRAFRLAHAILYSAIFLAPFDTLRPFNFIYLTLSDVLFLAAGALSFGWRVSISPLSSLRGWWAAGFGCMAVGYLMSAIVAPSDVSMYTLTALLQLAFVLLYLPWLLERYCHLDMQLLLRVFLFGLGASIAVALVAERIAPVQVVFQSLGAESVGDGRRFGAFLGSNGLAKLVASCVPVTLALWVLHRFQLGMMLFLSAMFFWAVIGSASNGGAIAFAVALGLSLLLVARGRRLGRVLFVLAGSAGLVWLLFVIAKVDTSVFVSRVKETLLSGDISEAGSFELKLSLMETAWATIIRSPVLGHGANSFTLLHGVSIHNSYLLMWFEGGVLALFGLLLVLGGAVRLLWKAARNSDSRVELALYGLVFVAVFAGNLMTGTDIYQRFRMCSLLLVVYASVQSPKVPPARPPGTGRSPAFRIGQ